MEICKYLLDNLESYDYDFVWNLSRRYNWTPTLSRSHGKRSATSTALTTNIAMGLYNKASLILLADTR